MDFEIYFGDLNEETQKALLNAAGMQDPEEANWDVFPVATVSTEMMLHDKAEEIMTDYLNGEDAEEMLEQLRSLKTEGSVTDDLYDYIIENWDELLDMENNKEYLRDDIKED